MLFPVQFVWIMKDIQHLDLQKGEKHHKIPNRFLPSAPGCTDVRTGENMTEHTKLLSWNSHGHHTDLSANGTTGLCWFLSQMPLIKQLDSTLLRLPTTPLSGN